VYYDFTELTREQFSALFSADLDASDDDFGGFEPVKQRGYDGHNVT